jgi:multidrug efflux system membrane fusion protein
VLGGLALLAACTEEKASGKSGPPTPPGVPVIAATVVQKPVPVQVRAIGNVQAISFVTIKSQVDGQVLHVHFTEGQEVKAGDLLFSLDPRPLEAELQRVEAALARDRAQLKQVEAALAKDRAQLANARVQERRYKELVADGAISSELYDTVRTTAETFEAAVQADLAAVETARSTIQADEAVVANARVQAGYTAIRAPMTGRTGNLLVHPGSAVKARDDQGAMVVINQLDPIYVTFAVPQRYLADITRYLAEGTLTVEAVPQGQEADPARGKVTFVNNTVDPSTGTIQLKATFANAGKRLWPGQFLNAVLTLTTDPSALVVPSQAIQTGQQGPYIFVIKPDLTVETRSVVVTRTLGLESVVEKGVAPGERVVADGAVRLVPGARVEIRTSPAPAAPAGRKAG